MQDKKDFKDKGLFVLIAVYAFTALLSTAASYIIESIGLVLLLLSYKKWHVLWQEHRILLTGVAIYITAYCITSLTAVDKMLAMDLTKGQIEPSILLVMVLVVSWNKRRMAIVATLLAMGLLVNDTYAFYQWTFLGADRPTGFVKQSMVLFSEYIALLLPIFYLCFLRGYNRISTVVSGGLVVVTSILMIANSYKMVWIVTTLAFLFITIWWFFRFSKRMENKKKLLVLPLVLIAMVGAFAFSSNVQQRFARAVHQPSTFYEERLVLWDIGKQLFLKHPFLGVGPGNYGPMKYPYWERDHSNVFINYQLINSHNIVVQTAAEQGVVGLVSLAFLFGGIFATGIRLMNSKQAFWGMGILILTSCLFMTGMSEYTMGYKPLMRLYWFLLGSLFVLAHLDQPSLLKGAHARE